MVYWSSGLRSVAIAAFDVHRDEIHARQLQRRHQLINRGQRHQNAGMRRFRTHHYAIGRKVGVIQIQREGVVFIPYAFRVHDHASAGRLRGQIAPDAFHAGGRDFDRNHRLRPGLQRLAREIAVARAAIQHHVAGWALMGPVEDTPIAEARAQMETNLFGVLRVCRAALPVMREQRSGHIVNISSLGGIFGIPFSGIYSAEYEREIMGKLAEMEREECRGQAAPKLDNPKKGAGDQKAGGRTPAPGSVPDQRSGPDRDRRDRCGNVQLVLSEYGTDVSMFPTEKQLVSHITLAPHKAMSGGQPVKKQKKRGSASSRVAAGLRMAALSLRNSKTALDAYYRHVAARKGGDVAVFATARKLATLIYRLLRWGQPYLDAGAAAYEKRYQEGRIQTPNC